MSLLKMKTKSLLKNNKSARANLPYRQAHAMGILFTVEDKQKHDDIKDFIKRLEQDGKEVKVMSFLPKEKENFEFMFDFFTAKDVNFWGTINSPSALRFSEVPFDFLFYVDEQPNPFLLNLLARSKARCRVSRHWENTEPYFEMMIESKAGNRALIDGMIRYTTKLR